MYHGFRIQTFKTEGLMNFNQGEMEVFKLRHFLVILGHLHPMNIFLRQEIDRMQKVISSVRSTLYDLKLAIEGTIIMSETLRDALDCMYDAKIPKAWLRVRQ